MVKKVAAITMVVPMVVVVALWFIMDDYNGVTSLASGYTVQDDLPSMDGSKNHVGTDR